MSAWPEQPKHIGAITLLVEDLSATRAFYETVFELPVFYQDDDSAVFRFGDTLINLLAAAAAGELIEPATIAAVESGARSQFTVDVADVDAAGIELERRGVKLLNGPMDRPWGIRTLSFADPAGHIWELAQDLP